MAIVNGQGRVGIRVTSGASSSPYLLNNYSGSSAAFSLRRLSSTSTYAIRVRRSSDNTEQNIGFDGSGNLDTTALTTFVGAGNGFVVTWYDQSGNNRNAVQVSAGYQPQIVSSGTILTKNGKPTVSFNGNSNLVGNQKIINNTAVSIFTVFSVNSLTNRAAIWDIGTATGFNHFTLDVNTWSTSGQKFGFYTCNSSFDSSLSTNLNQNLVSIIADTTVGNNIISNTKYSLNSTLGTLTGSASDTYRDFSTVFNDPINKFSIGSFDTRGIPLSGQIQEIVFYPTNKTTTQTSIESNINTYYSIYTPLDTDASAFVSAAGITNSTQISAVNTLVTSLKSAGIWSKMKAIYPVVGGNATAHSKNLINPNLYNLTFTSGWVHSNTGMLPNGTSAYASTGIKVSDFAPDSMGLGVYLRTNNDGLFCDVGTIDTSRFQLLSRYSNNIYSGLPNGNVLATGAVTDSRGFTTIGRVTTTSRKTFKNGVLKFTSSETLTSTTGINTYDFKIGGSGGSSLTWYSNRENSFTVFKMALTDSEESTLNTLVQAFQTTLGRQV